MKMELFLIQKWMGRVSGPMREGAPCMCIWLTFRTFHESLPQDSLIDGYVLGGRALTKSVYIRHQFPLKIERHLYSLVKEVWDQVWEKHPLTMTKPLFEKLGSKVSFRSNYYYVVAFDEDAAVSAAYEYGLRVHAEALKSGGVWARLHALQERVAQTPVAEIGGLFQEF